MCVGVRWCVCSCCILPKYAFYEKREDSFDKWGHFRWSSQVQRSGGMWLGLELGLGWRGLAGMVRSGLGLGLWKSSQRKKYKDVCFCTRAAVLNPPPNKKLASVGFVGQKILIPKWQKNLWECSDEGRVNWWSRHRSTYANLHLQWFTTCTEKNPMHLKTSLQMYSHESVCSVYQLEDLLCFVKWNLNWELPLYFKLTNRFVSYWLFHHFKDVFKEATAEHSFIR